ncbi:hypothetical protein CVS40_5231 [Lucilia cuprina]|nr:hypothetical protein CVS40_5231 [Lucilia cuprina]
MVYVIMVIYTVDLPSDELCEKLEAESLCIVQMLFGYELCTEYSNSDYHPISIKCYVCDDKKSCKRPSLKECNPKLANRTRTYIFAFHKDASTNATSTVYECFQEYIETPSTDYYYKGCTYANIKGCELPLDNVFENCKRECNQCNDKNGCNPAGHFQIEFMTLIATILMGFVINCLYR